MPLSPVGALKISSKRPLRSIYGGSTLMLFGVAARKTPLSRSCIRDGVAIAVPPGPEAGKHFPELPSRSMALVQVASYNACL
jgi:hypothetical protein